jgi:hypothetical protein
MGVAQVAQVLRKTQTHVNVLLFRARQTLAREITAGLPTKAPASPNHVSRFTFHVAPP